MMNIVDTEVPTQVITAEPPQYDYSAIPDCIREYKQWLPWVRGNAGEPVMPLGSVTDPTTWQTFEQALSAFQSGLCEGIGFCLTDDDPFAFGTIDENHPKLAEYLAGLSEFEQEYDNFDALKKSYCEETPAGQTRLLCLSYGDPLKAHWGNLDLSNTFIPMTGKHIEGSPIGVQYFRRLKMFGGTIYDKTTGASLPGAYYIEDDESQAVCETLFPRRCTEVDGHYVIDLFRCPFDNGSNGEHHATYTMSRAYYWDDDYSFPPKDSSFECTNPECRSHFNNIHKLRPWLESRSKTYQEGVQDNVLQAEEEAEKIEAGIVKAPRLEDFFSLPGKSKVLTATKWLIPGILPQKATAMTFGPSKTYKTFVELDKALHVATGLDYYGKPVKQGLVVYVAAEGADGIAKRKRGWFKRHPQFSENHAPFICNENPMKLITEKDFELLDTLIDMAAERFGAPVLIVIDTVTAATNGRAESSTERAGSFIQKLRHYLIERYGASTLFIHHCGKDETRGARGPSNFYNDVETVSYIDYERIGKKGTPTGNGVIVGGGGDEFNKMKDDPLPAPVFVKMESVEWMEETGMVDTLVPVRSSHTIRAESTLSHDQIGTIITTTDALIKDGVVPQKDVVQQIRDDQRLGSEFDISEDEKTVRERVQALVPEGENPVDTDCFAGDGYVYWRQKKTTAKTAPWLIHRREVVEI